MGKHSKKHGGGRSTGKFLFKIGATLVGGAVLGEILSPVTGPISGPALGVAAVGLPVWGLRPGYLAYAGMPAIALQVLKLAQEPSGVIGTPVLAAKASLAGATRALKSGATTTEDDALARARAAAGR